MFIVVAFNLNLLQQMKLIPVGSDSLMIYQDSDKHYIIYVGMSVLLGRCLFPQMYSGLPHF